MKQWSGWVLRPLAAVVLLLLAAPLALVRPEPSRTVQPVAEDCPRRLLRAGPAAAEPGVSMAVLTGGRLRTCVAGSRDAWTGRAVTPETVFDAGSLSKPVVAYAALRLVDRGQLDLDEPLADLEGGVTLRRLLSHTAGFDNSLSGRPTPAGPAGPFRYSGSGYILVGKEIERVTGQAFHTHMNSVVLPELGMSNSSFGPGTGSAGGRATPSVDAGLIVAAFGLSAGTLGLVAIGLLALLFRLLRVGQGHRRRAGQWAVALSMAAGAAAPVWLLGWPNTAAVLVPMMIFAASLAVLVWSFGRGGLTARTVVIAAAAMALLLPILRPAVPLAPRNQTWLAPAGLRTTAPDYARFLAQVTAPTLEANRGAISLLRVPQAAVSPSMGWTLGLGQRQGADPALWHWGVNFPGYQALAIAWPDGQVAVVLVNGGALSVSPSGLRYSGLELAQEAVTELRGTDQGSLWRGIQ